MRSAEETAIQSEIVQTLMRTINRIAVSRRLSRTYGEGGPLTMIEAEMCWLVLKQEGISGSRLAEQLGVTRSAVSQLLGKLRQKGLVEDDGALSDARVRGVRLTEKGKASASVAMHYACRMEDELFLGASPEELTHYLRLVTKLESFHQAVLAETGTSQSGV